MITAAFVVSILALLVSCGAVWYARGQQLAAERAARASEVTAELQKQSERRAVEAAERNLVVWTLEPVGRSRHVLHNQGTQSAYGVHVDRGDLVVEGGGTADFDEFPSGHRESYVLAGGNTPTNSIMVIWHQERDHSDEPRSQQLIVLF